LIARRGFLKAAALGLGARAGRAAAQSSGRGPGAPGDLQPVHEISGRVTVNGEQASPSTRIRPGDAVATGPAAHVVFATGKNAFLVRERSSLVLDAATGGLRLATGALLAVFGPGDRQVTTPTAIFGIRGTGAYFEAEPTRTYVCVCYGTVQIAGAADPRQVETVVSRHHDSPRYVMASGPSMIVAAPVVNHTDDELLLLEALVGRKPPFGAAYGTGGRY
jgi:hypothetical protein